MTDMNFPESSGPKLDHAAIRRQRWYPVVDDTIGGYLVANVNKPASEHDWRRGEVGVASFMSEDDAKHIARLHNEWLARQEQAEREATKKRGDLSGPPRNCYCGGPEEAVYGHPYGSGYYCRRKVSPPAA